MPYPAPSPNRYLDGRVTSASQPELHLMMLDGAVRFGQQARGAWDDPLQHLEADRLLRRTLDIVEELVRSVAVGSRAESKRLEEEYAFIFRQLGVAQLEHDAKALDSALKLLAYQRETWRLTCEQLKARPVPATNVAFADVPTTGFSFQA